MAYKAFVSYSHAADNKLAPMLQSALQKFAKPFYKLRAIDIFRDKTSLHLTPELWPEIQKALGQSEFFILLASPDSAKSHWVQKEVDEWLKLKNGAVDKFLIVLTDGSLEWDDAANDFDWERTDALPPNLCKKFKSVPLFSDMRLVNKSKEPSLRHPQFLDEVGTLAATLHDRPKDKMIGEDVKQHRVVKATVTATLVLLLLLAAGASVAAYVATQQKARADEQRGIADEQRGIADVQKDIAEQERDNAQTQARIADEQRELAVESARLEKIARSDAEESARKERQARIKAETNERLATARQLAAQAGQSLTRTDASDVIESVDPRRGVLLALESLNRVETPEGVSALRQALATLEGRNKSPLLVKDRSLTLKTLGPESKWAVATFYDPENKSDGKGTMLIDPKTGSASAAGLATDLPNWLPPSEKDKTFTFSADGSRLLTLNKSVLKVWDVQGQKLSYPISLGSDIVNSSLGVSGKWLVTLSNLGMIRVWDVAAKKEAAHKQVGEEFASVAISDDGNLVAVGSKCVTARHWNVYVWQVKGWHRVATLAHEWDLQGMAFSSDGRWLTTITGNAAANAADNGETALVGSTVRVWRIRDRRLVTNDSLAAHGGITSMAFTPDGLWLATTSNAYRGSGTKESTAEASDTNNTTLRLWQLTPDDLRRTACMKLDRNLSKSEWDTFISIRPRGQTCPGLRFPQE